MDIFDGFEVHMFNGSNFLNGSIAIMTDGNEHCERAIVKGSLVDLFELDGKACNEDLENKVIFVFPPFNRQITPFCSVLKHNLAKSVLSPGFSQSIST